MQGKKPQRTLHEGGTGLGCHMQTNRWRIKKKIKKGKFMKSAEKNNPP